MLERLATYLDGRTADFNYIREHPRMEIWIKGREWYPILISEISRGRYVVYWGDVRAGFSDPDEVFCYMLKVFKVIKSEC
ncbi:hypothetical protein ACFOET_17785 [Parapedobacter deserti]|uniref:Uncharacterized protein n=1 Tax=Parapedobacter deserti TaxID=1912957 RepID=A0ABV7JT84_9SPHI